MQSSADLIIIGSGSTAFAAALRATGYGARVVMFEKSVLGGTCINWGCIPSKTLIHAALFNYEAAHGALIGLGSGSDVRPPDGERLFRHRESVVTGLRKERYLDVLAGMQGLELVKGTARLLDQHTVICNERRYRAERILLAVGGSPRIPDLPGVINPIYKLK
jgi:mercuric reductase